MQNPRTHYNININTHIWVEMSRENEMEPAEKGLIMKWGREVRYR